ncbi:hypothetical protein KRX11_10240 [Pasteurellaceae bacterium TAE3-ERU1]|nr:hypothetical protein [Pasteurellaceae bacterium TAE3-ERU1]
MKVFEKINIFHTLFVVAVTTACCTQCTPQPQEAKDTDYYNHTVSYEPTADDMAQARAIWNKEEGELQSDLTPEVELYLRQKVADMQR